jgi:hypothetical protein
MKIPFERPEVTDLGSINAHTFMPGRPHPVSDPVSDNGFPESRPPDLGGSP